MSDENVHDRLILIDDREVWTLGQSFKDIAVRAPTSLHRVDGELAGMKVQAYEEIWTSAQIIE